MLEERKSNVLLNVFDAVKCQLKIQTAENDSWYLPVPHHDRSHDLRQDSCVARERALRLEDRVRDKLAERRRV